MQHDLFISYRDGKSIRWRGDCQYEKFGVYRLNSTGDDQHFACLGRYGCTGGLQLPVADKYYFEYCWLYGHSHIYRYDLHADPDS
jgi:hypothetical protein